MIKLRKITPKLGVSIAGVGIELEFECVLPDQKKISDEAHSMLYEILSYGSSGNAVLDAVSSSPSHTRGLTIYPPKGARDGYTPFVYEGGRTSPTLLTTVQAYKFKNAVAELIDSDILVEIDPDFGTKRYLLVAETAGLD